MSPSLFPIIIHFTVSIIILIIFVNSTLIVVSVGLRTQAEAVSGGSAAGGGCSSRAGTHKADHRSVLSHMLPYTLQFGNCQGIAPPDT